MKLSRSEQDGDENSKLPRQKAPSEGLRLEFVYGYDTAGTAVKPSF